MVLNPGEWVGKYEIQQYLGGGNFGKVYHVRDAALDAEKAIKILDIADPQQMKELFEAQVLHRCRHDNNVQVNEANVMEIGREFKLVIDMEYLPEGSVERRMQNHFLTADEIIRHTAHVLYGLGFAHQQGVLHRDIKPANVLISGNISKLSDFGLAMPQGQGPQAVRGYRSHVAPEIFGGAQNSIATDIFAVGMTLFRFVNQISDWRGLLNGMPDAQKLIQNGKMIQKLGFADYVPRQFRTIVRKACNLDPAKRYQNCEEFRQALERLRLQNNWLMHAVNSWTCGVNGAFHELEVETNRNSKVVYKINGRRRRDLCSSHADEQEAIALAHRIVADSTFG